MFRLRTRRKDLAELAALNERYARLQLQQALTATVAEASLSCVSTTTNALISLRRRDPIGRRTRTGTMWLRAWAPYITKVLGRHGRAASQRGA